MRSHLRILERSFVNIKRISFWRSVVVGVEIVDGGELESCGDGSAMEGPGVLEVLPLGCGYTSYKRRAQIRASYYVLARK